MAGNKMGSVFEKLLSGIPCGEVFQITASSKHSKSHVYSLDNVEVHVTGVPMKKAWEEYKREFRNFALDRGQSSYDIELAEFEVWEAHQEGLEVVIAYNKIF